MGYADKDGNTALHHASYMGLHATVTALLQSGANGWASNASGDIPMSLKWLPLRAGPKPLALHRAVVKRQLLPDSLLKSVLMNIDFEYRILLGARLRHGAGYPRFGLVCEGSGGE